VKKEGKMHHIFETIKRLSNH